MKKYSIFHIDGGLGKHIAATAVARCIKNNHPDRELIVVAAWPSPFVNLDFVDRVYKQGMTPYFYQDYIDGKDSLLFKHEPYFTTDHVHKNRHLIENWCNLYNLEYSGESPELVFNLREKQLAGMMWNSEKPLMVIQSHGGLFKSDNSFFYRWTRDIPIGILNNIVDEFSSQYSIFQITRPGSPIANNATVIDQEFNPMELITILFNSHKRLLIDSMLQHAASALKLSSTVLWIGTSPRVFGYDIHENIEANKVENFKLPDSYLFDYNFEGITHECPYKNEDEIFDVDQIIASIKRQGL